VSGDPTVGAEIAGYRIETVLGSGAMGVVYRARQRSPDRDVAFKIITPAFARDPSFRRRFLREVDAAAAIEHPHILPVYEAGEFDGSLFMASRLVTGPDLRQILGRSGALDVERAIEIVRQVGEALDAAHARGLVHRDVKPGNILVTQGSDGRDFCYLVDFGVSTWSPSAAATVTATGQLAGTANYVSPEQVEGGAVDGRADIYALGCVFYECLTGRPPFAGRGPAAILYAHLHEAPTPLRSQRPDLPSSIDAVVDRMLAKQPAERYASCSAMSDDLRSAIAAPAGQPASPAAPPVGARSVPYRRSSAWLAGFVAAAIAALAIVGGALFALSGGSGGDGGTGSSSSPRLVLIRRGIQVTASSTAPASTDAAGNPVTYVPMNVVDGDVSTAWRTPGDGKGAWVTLIFDNPIDVVRIGMIPGYAKVDPTTGANRFEQDRIITSVRYDVPGLPSKTQTFRPVPAPQFMRLGATTSRITVRILGTTPAGGLDYTAISEIYVYAYRQ
jgi:serine/threonine protein kinase